MGLAFPLLLSKDSVMEHCHLDGSSVLNDKPPNPRYVFLIEAHGCMLETP